MYTRINNNVAELIISGCKDCPFKVCQDIGIIPKCFLTGDEIDVENKKYGTMRLATCKLSILYVFKVVANSYSRLEGIAEGK